MSEIATIGGGHVLGAGYDPFLVALSILVAIGAAFLALTLAARRGQVQGRVSAAWWAAGSIGLGLAFFSLSITAMVGVRLDVPVSYHPGPLVLSLLAAMVAAGAVLYAAGRAHLNKALVLTGGAVAGLALAAMHFSAMASLQLDALPRYTPGLVALTLALALASATGLVWLAAGQHGSPLGSRRLASALTLGMGLVGMQYTGMTAVRFWPTDITQAPLTGSLHVSELDTILVALSAFAVLAAGLLSAYQEFVSRRHAAEIARYASELEAANLRLRQADGYKDQFLSVISHELRTPLNFITGFASILDDELPGPLNPQQHTYMGKILNGSERMLHLVNDLLDFAKIQADKLELDPGPTSVEPLVEEVVASLQPLALKAGLRLESLVHAPGLLEMDGHRVTQVLTNLVSNAIKFSPPGGRVVVKAFMRGDELVTQVTDSGVGIRAEDIPKLFTKFQQLDMSATRHAGGTGLGLSISKALVEAHGGRIGVISEPGAGSTFWFILPAVGVAAPQAPQATTL